MQPDTATGYKEKFNNLPSHLKVKVRLEQQKQKATKKTTKYQAFQEKYFNDFAGFIRDCVNWAEGEAPTGYQLEIAQSLLQHERYALRGPRGLGKTALAALVILAYALTRDGKDWKIVTTASNGTQLREYLWPEIHKWSSMLKWDIIGRKPFHKVHELQIQNLSLSTGRAFAVIPGKSPEKQGDSMEGAHADHLFYLFDEAKEIPDSVFNSVEGAFSSKGEALLFVISTPGAQMGRFYDIHRRAKGLEHWAVRHVTTEEVVIAGRVKPSWIAERANEWGVTDFRYLNQVEGEFAADSTNGVIPFSFVSRANLNYELWQDKINYPPPPDYMGVDVGDTVDDSVIAFYTKPAINKLYQAIEELRAATRANVSIYNGLGGYIEVLKNSDQYTTGEVIRVLTQNLAYDPNLAASIEATKALLAPYKCISAMRKHVITEIKTIKKLNPDAATMQVAGEVKGYLDLYPNCIASIDSIGIGAGVVHRLMEQGYKSRVIAFDVREKTHHTDHTGRIGFNNKRSAMWYLGYEMLHPETGGGALLPRDDSLIAELTVVQLKSHNSDNQIQVEAKKDIKKRLQRSTDSADAVLMAMFGNVLGGISSEPLDLAAFLRANGG